PGALAVLNRLGRVILGQAVREEDPAVERVGLGRVDGVAGEEDEEDAGGEDKGVLHHGLADARDEPASAAALGETLGRAAIAGAGSAKGSREMGCGRGRNGGGGRRGAIAIAGVEAGAARGECWGARVAGADVAAEAAALASPARRIRVGEV